MLNYSIVEEFLGVKANAEWDVVNSEETTFFDYKGKVLNYSILLQHNCNQVGVSGSTGLPFGGDSFFEFCVRCDLVTNKSMHLNDLFKHHLGENGLYFWEIDSSKIENLTLQIHIRKDGDLTIWPTRFSSNFK